LSQKAKEELLAKHQSPIGLGGKGPIGEGPRPLGDGRRRGRKRKWNSHKKATAWKGLDECQSSPVRALVGLQPGKGGGETKDAQPGHGGGAAAVEKVGLGGF